MVACDILDLRCVFVNELIGSLMLSVVVFALVYFIIASKNRWGFNATIVTLVPILLIGGLALTGFSVIFAFATIIIGLLFAALINRLLSN